MTNPSANQNRPPSPDPYRYVACVSWAWLVLRAMEVAHTNAAVPVLPEAILDKESPAGEWVLQPKALLNHPVTFIKQVASTVFNFLLKAADLVG